MRNSRLRRGRSGHPPRQGHTRRRPPHARGLGGKPLVQLIGDADRGHIAQMRALTRGTHRVELLRGWCSRPAFEVRRALQVRHLHFSASAGGEGLVDGRSVDGDVLRRWWLAGEGHEDGHRGDRADHDDYCEKPTRSPPLCGGRFPCPPLGASTLTALPASWGVRLRTPWLLCLPANRVIDSGRLDA